MTTANPQDIERRSSTESSPAVDAAAVRRCAGVGAPSRAWPTAALVAVIVGPWTGGCQSWERPEIVGPPVRNTPLSPSAAVFAPQTPTSQTAGNTAAYRVETGLTATHAEPPAGASPTQAGEAATLPPYTEKISGTVVEFSMVPVPAGTGTDGSAVPAFYIGATEVTWDMYDAFVFGLDVPEGGQPESVKPLDGITKPSKPYLIMDRGFGHAGYPVISVNSNGALEFCKWLSAKTGKTYRLPTEAEWELACKLGKASVAEQAWTKDTADAKTHPIGSKPADALGLRDMLGNASEWAVGSDGKPVTKGGSYRESADQCTCEARVPWTSAWNRSDPQIPKSTWWLADGGFVGFRVVCEVGGAGK